MTTQPEKGARQSAGKAMSDDYLVGFVEGEGCFYVSIVPSKETCSKWQVIHFFKVSQNQRGEQVLLQLQRRLGCGYIKRNASSLSRDKTLAYVVRNIQDLWNKVIPFFEGKLVIKKSDFEKFREILSLVIQKKHLTKDGIFKVIELSSSMNTQKRKYDAFQIMSSFS